MEKNKKKKVNTSVYLSEEDMKLLQVLCERNHRSQSNQIAVAIRDMARRENIPFPDTTGN